MRYLLLMVVTACGAAPTVPLANRAATSAPLACTDALVAKLGAALAARWEIAPPDVRCAPGQFARGVDGYFLEARAPGLRRTGVVDASGVELVPFVDEPLPSAPTFVNGYLAADLDGDGDDEIIESWRRGTDSWLVIRRIADGRFARRMGPYLARSHPELGSCSSTWEIRRHRIQVAVKLLPGIPPTDCLRAGIHRFALRAGALRLDP
jgi:hypothetical protein